MTNLASADFPPVYQAELDEETSLALFRDWGALDAIAVSVKRAERAYVEESEVWTLTRAREALESGSVRAIQVRYVHEGRTWTDTLLRHPGGLRLVRMAAEAE
jgi:hypothetical protein